MPTRTVGFDKFQRKLKKMSKAVDDMDDKTLMKVTGEVRNRIVKRTMRGRDSDMKSFKPYSTDYSKFRAKKGKKTGRPNLVMTFAMLGNMSFKKIRGGSMIHFTSTAQNDKAYWNQQSREFFGLSKHNHKYVLSELRQPVVKAMR